MSCVTDTASVPRASPGTQETSVCQVSEGQGAAGREVGEWSRVSVGPHIRRFTGLTEAGGWKGRDNAGDGVDVYPGPGDSTWETWGFVKR